jgi:hypothetical protein
MQVMRFHADDTHLSKHRVRKIPGRGWRSMHVRLHGSVSFPIVCHAEELNIAGFLSNNPFKRGVEEQVISETSVAKNSKMAAKRIHRDGTD